MIKSTMKSDNGLRVVHVGPPVVTSCGRPGWVMVSCTHGHVTNILRAHEWKARKLTELVCFETDR